MRGKLAAWVEEGHISRSQMDAILAAEDRRYLQGGSPTGLVATAAVVAAVFISLLVTFAVVEVTQANDGHVRDSGILHMVVGAAILAAAALARLPRDRREPALLAGVGVLCMVNLFAEDPQAWALVPGVAVAWATLAVPLAPETRVGMTVVAALGSLGVSVLVLQAAEGPVLAGLIAAHLIGTWLVLPVAAAQRSLIMFALLGVAAVAAFATLWFLVTAPTVRRLGAFAVIAVVAGAIVWLQGREWHIEPTWEPWDNPDGGAAASSPS